MTVNSETFIKGRVQNFFLKIMENSIKGPLFQLKIPTFRYFPNFVICILKFLFLIFCLKLLIIYALRPAQQKKKVNNKRIFGYK